MIVRDGRLALIERHRDGRHYWVIPGGTIEAGESIEAAARREALEELGAPAELGRLRVRIDHRELDGSIQPHWYFDAWLASDAIAFDGPEALSETGGTYEAVWVPLGDVEPGNVLPAAVARLVIENAGRWPPELIEIDER